MFHIFIHAIFSVHFLGETLNKHCSELAFPTYDAVDIVFRLFDVF